MTSRWLRQLRIVGVAFSQTWTASEATFVACAQDRGVAADAKPSRTEDDAEQVRKGRLDEMRRLAEGTVVSRLDGAEKVLARLVAEPVFRFDSQYYGAIDATLWLYGDEGRPAAAQTVVCWRRPGFPKHEYCLVSLSEGLIEAQWAGDRQWLSTSPGITVRPLPDGPKPAPTEAARTRQMKEMIRRFAATRIDKMPGRDIREECRVLPQSIRRYRDPESGIQDGAIFVAVAAGTAPDFYLLIELRGPDLEHAVWNYGMHRTTTAELHVRLDGKEVWTVPQESHPGHDVYATYLHFFPRQEEPGSR